MTIETITTVTKICRDDLDGSDGAETVEFHDMDGHRLLIDLSTANRDELHTAMTLCRETLVRFVDHARVPAAPTRNRRATAYSRLSDADKVAFKAYQASLGRDTQGPGRYPDAAVQAWTDANKRDSSTTNAA